MTDEALCLAARSGEREAEAVLAERYLPVVRACARPYFLAGGSSEDVTQEGMLGLLVAIREYDPDRGSLRTFAERCIRSRILDSLRKATREKHIPLNTYISISQDPLPHQSAPGPEEDFLDRESYSERLGKMREPLSGFEDKVLGLYLEGLSTAEIAERLMKTPKSVDNAVQRVRRKLARHLQSGEYGQ